MQNRVTCIAGERIWKGDRVYVPPHGHGGRIFRAYGKEEPRNELGEALEDAQAGGLCVVARDDGNVPLRRGRTLTQNLEED